MARYGRFGAVEADRCRIAEAALDRRAVHPDGRVLAGDGVSEGLDRRTARMFRGVLRRAPRVKQRRLQLRHFRRLGMGHRGYGCVGQAGDIACRSGHRFETAVEQEGGLSPPVHFVGVAQYCSQYGF